MSDFASFSGTVSLFARDRHAEIAFPLFWGQGNSDHRIAEFDVDCHYRYFLGNNQKGFYLSGFLRYAYLHGYTEDPAYKYIGHSANRAGIGAGLGYRIFSQKGFYWGAGLIIGRYMDAGYRFDIAASSLSSLLGSLTSSSYGILEFEILKFGWAF